MNLFFAIAVLAATAVGGDDAAFCLSNGNRLVAAGSECHSAGSLPLHVEPAEHARAWAWIKGERVALGVLPPGSHAIAPSGSPLHMEVQKDEHLSESGPITMNITSSDSSAQWEIPLASERVEVGLPEGCRCTIELSRERHYRWSREITGAEENDGSTLKVRLAPWPAIRGRTLHGVSGEPLFGAIVRDHLGTILTGTDVDGRFEFDAEELPPQVEIDYPGLALRRVDIPSAGGLLAPITLFPSATIVIVINDGDAMEPLRYRLRRQGAGQRWIDVRAGAISPGAPASIERLHPDKYLLILEGNEETERLTRWLELHPGQIRREEIDIRPIAVMIEITRGSARLADARLLIRSTGGRWSSTLIADERGEISATFWEEGDFVTAVRHSVLATPYVSARSVAAPDVTWQLRIPSAEISGRVIDHESGRGIASAKVILHSENDDSSRIQPTQTDGDGNYRFSGTETGVHSLAAEAEGYVPGEPVSVTVGSDDQASHIDLRLRTGRDVDVVVRRPDGSVIPGAVILLLSPRGALLGSATAANDGSAVVKLPPDSPGILAAVDPDGSFAIVELESRHNQTAIVIPRGVAAIRIIAHDADDRPMKALTFSIRHEHRLLPPALIALLESRRGGPFVTDGNGEVWITRLPPGFYEVIPLEAAGSTQQAEQLPALNVASGTYELRLRFRPPRSRVSPWDVTR